MFSLLKSLLRKSAPARPAAAAPRAQGREFVAFITAVDAPHFLGKGEALESDQASMRLRVGVPARELARTFPVCLVPIDHVRHDPALASLGAMRAAVVGKLPMRFFAEERGRAAALAEWIENTAPAHRIVVDFADDIAAAAAMASQPGMLELQQRLLQAAPATVPTQALRDRLAPFAPHGVSVIEDPYESLRAGEAGFAPGPRLHLAWFGVFGEPLRPFIEGELEKLARALARPVDLAFVTYESQAALVRDMAARLCTINPQFALRHVPWSVAATANELARADIVVIPQDARSDWGRAKSHNRLVEAIRAGRYTVASPIPAYLELRDYAWVDDDLAAGIEWALARPAEAKERIVRGQACVAERFAPSRIAAQWARVLGV